MEHLFFSGWPGLVRTLVLGVLSYLLLIAILRVSGKRTLSKMNAFDLVVTVALGSTLATILLNKQIALAEGVLALLLLIALQFSITWLAVRSRLVESLVKNEPALLMRSGKLLRDGMRRERVTESEIRSALRSQVTPATSRVSPSFSRPTAVSALLPTPHRTTPIICRMIGRRFNRAAKPARAALLDD
jgi:uncharacterized membrane protein YcaP (DUF421 family)